MIKTIIVNTCLGLVWLGINLVILPIKAGMWVYYFLFDREIK